MDVRVALDRQDALGEGPLWSPDEGFLYWTDILGKKLWRWDTKPRSQAELVFEGRTVGGFTLAAGGGLLLFMEEGRVGLLLNGELETEKQVLGDQEGGRFNDVCAGPAGSVFCGTLFGGGRKGALYRLAPNGTTTVLMEGCGCPNGMGFSPDLKFLYYSESAGRTIWRFPIDAATDETGPAEEFLEFDEAWGVPDGMTVDSRGHLWIAFWGGSCIREYTPSGELVRKIEVPAQRTTSLAFSGPELRTAYVTSAALEEGSPQGALFAFEAEAPGQLEFLARPEFLA